MACYLDHPVFQDMLQLGSKNQMNAAIAFQVYMDLCEGLGKFGEYFNRLEISEDPTCKCKENSQTAKHVLWEYGFLQSDRLIIQSVRVLRDVEYGYNKEIDSIYLAARESHSSEEPEIYLPLSSTSMVDLSWIRAAQNALSSNEGKRRIMLALRAQDSTVVYYKMTEGMVPPDSPETARQKKLLSEKRHYLRKELQQRQLQLLDEACANKENAKDLKERSNINSSGEPGMNKNTSSAEVLTEEKHLDTEIVLNTDKNGQDVGDKNIPEIQEIDSEIDTSCSY